MDLDKINACAVVDTPSRATVVTNFGYLKTVPGLLKVAQLIFTLMSLVLLSTEGTGKVYQYKWTTNSGIKSGRGIVRPSYKDWSENEFLLLSSFAFFLTTFVILLSSIMSFMTSCTLPKTAFFYFYHSFGCIFLITGGLTVMIQEGTFQRRGTVISAGVFGFLASFLYGADFLFAYQKEYGLSPAVLWT